MIETFKNLIEMDADQNRSKGRRKKDVNLLRLNCITDSPVFREMNFQKSYCQTENWPKAQRLRKKKRPTTTKSRNRWNRLPGTLAWYKSSDELIVLIVTTPPMANAITIFFVFNEVKSLKSKCRKILFELNASNKFNEK